MSYRDPLRLHAPLLPLAACLMVGIGASNRLTGWTVGLAALAVAIGAAVALRRWPRLQTVAVCCAVLLLGATLGARQRQLLSVAWSASPQPETVVVVSEPVVSDHTVTADVLTVAGRHKVRCRFRRDSRSERIGVGHGLLIHTRFSAVHAYRRGHFDYQRYMSCQGFAGEARVGRYDWQWQSVPLDRLSRVDRLRLRFLQWRHRLLERYRRWGLSGDVYGVLTAMTLGEKSQIGAVLRDTYSRVGAAHVLALSGLHLMIVYSVVTLFLGWRRFRLLSQVLVVLSVWAFALLVGLSPSVVRSAAMLSVYALLSLGHREKLSVNTLAFVAMVMLVASPMSLYDVGFQLSFMAVLSIALLTPLLQRVVPLHVQQRHRWLKAVWGLTVVSLSAQAGTAPLVAYYFGRFSTWFLLSNFVAVPLATVVLYLALATLLTFWWTALQELLVVALSSVVAVMNRLLGAIATLPLCVADGIRLTALQLLCVYVLLACVYVLAALLVRSKSAGRAAGRSG